MMTITTPDGRRLDVSVSGPDDGTPLVLHHGTPGSLTPVSGLREAAHARGLRVVAYSRPGYGGSTRLPGRAAVDAAADVAAVLDHLDAPRCVVAGWSGGGPHALAAAALLPDRVAGALLMASMAPYGVPGLDALAGMGESNIREFGKALEGESALRAFLEPMASALRGADAETLREALDSLLPDADRAVLAGAFAEQLSENFSEALRLGVDGWLDDDLAFVKPWGYDPADVTVPVFVWQGSEDLMAPLSHGRWLADHIPTATAHMLQGEGHMSIVMEPMATMMDELVGTL